MYFVCTFIKTAPTLVIWLHICPLEGGSELVHLLHRVPVWCLRRAQKEKVHKGERADLRKDTRTGNAAEHLRLLISVEQEQK